MRESVTRFWQLRRFESFYLLRRNPGRGEGMHRATALFVAQQVYPRLQ